MRADGRPHVAPIWFDLNDDVLIFTTGENTVKARNMRRDPRVSFCIDEEEPPFPLRRDRRHPELSAGDPDLLYWATPASAAAIWVQTGPMSTAVATRWRASCWCGSPRRRSSPTRTSLIDMLLSWYAMISLMERRQEDNGGNHGLNDLAHRLREAVSRPLDDWREVYEGSHPWIWRLARDVRGCRRPALTPGAPLC